MARLIAGSRKNNPEARMALKEHLLELRKRVVRIAIGLLLGAIVGWIFFDAVTVGPLDVFGWFTIGPIHVDGIFPTLKEPIDRLIELRPDIVTISYGGVGTAFDMQLRISLFAGMLLTSPWWIYQIFAFITPGLTKKERRYTFGFLGAAVPLFAAGAYLAWSVLPRALEILIGQFTPDGVANILEGATYLKFVMQLVIACGLAFLLPLFMVGLNFMGVVTGQTWLKAWRWAVIGIFTFCAFVTPNPEPTAMIFLAMPILALYFIAVGISLLHDKRVARRRAAEDAELDGGNTATDVASGAEA